MPTHKSAIKRVKQNEKRRQRNKAVRTRAKNANKAVREAVADKKDVGSVEAQLAASIQTLGESASAGAIPKRRASRKISRLTKLVNAYRAAKAPKA